MTNYLLINLEIINNNDYLIFNVFYKYNNFN